MTPPKFFKSKEGNIPLPVFFPDATRAVVKSLDTSDIESTKTTGILVNTYHLYKELGLPFLESAKGIRGYMDWKGGLISDSGGFQIGSLVKRNPELGKVTDEGVTFKHDGIKTIITPEKSIEIQMAINPDMLVVLDDFTDPNADYEAAKESVDRTIEWARRSKNEFERILKKLKIEKNNRPYLLGVVQGGYFQDLREYCAKELVKIGFDGFGYGGWPMNKDGKFDLESAVTIAKNTPDNYLLYGLGIGKPEDVVALSKIGYNIFDCVLPTRDARHGRLYVFNANSLEDIDLNRSDFYKLLDPTKAKYLKDFEPVSKACDCLLCKRYSKSYLTHLFKIGDFTAGRLATIHNLRFYSILMEKLKS